jgi:hypothetical protein
MGMRLQLQSRFDAAAAAWFPSTSAFCICIVALNSCVRVKHKAHRAAYASCTANLLLLLCWNRASGLARSCCPADSVRVWLTFFQVSVHTVELLVRVGKSSRLLVLHTAMQLADLFLYLDGCLAIAASLSAVAQTVKGWHSLLVAVAIWPRFSCHGIG